MTSSHAELPYHPSTRRERGIEQEPAASGLAPLSAEQEQIWLHAMLAAGLPLYNETVAINYRGALDVAALEAAFFELRRRHAILRTTVHEQNGTPLQRVEAVSPIRVETADCSGLDKAARELRAAELAAQFAQRPFDLAQGPLFRLLAAKLGPEENRLYLTLHHLIFDGESLRRILLAELVELYTAFAEKRGERPVEPGMQYADYALAQKKNVAAVREEALTFWRAKLADFAPLDLPVDRPRTPQTSFRGAMHRFALDGELCGALREFARQERTTIFNVFLASLVTLLARYCDTTDITVGTTYGGRSDTALEDVLGCFLNTLLLRTDLAGEPDFEDVLSRVREVTLEALEYADVPFQHVVRECLRKGGSSDAAVQVVFSFQPAPVDVPDDWDLDVFAVSSGTAKFDLHVEMEERERGFRARLQYNTDLFDASTIARLERHWMTLLKAAIGEPQKPVWKLPLLTGEEQTWLRRTLNASERAIPASCTHDLFVAKANEAPERIAIATKGRSLSYGELERQSGRLARHLVENGFGSGAVIGLMMERSPEMLVALLGILRAGSTYVPMDPKYPAARLEHMLNASGAGLLLTQASLDAYLPEVRVPRLDVVEFLESGKDTAGELPQVSTAASAYIIFTSGSTGVPKGVEIPHGALTNLLVSMQETPGMKADDVLLAVTSICFDIAALEMFLPVITGARIEIASAEEAADPEQLIRRITECDVTVLQATPVSWRMLIESGWGGTPGLKILCGGEALLENLAKQLVERAGSVWNMYGPTETTIWSSCARVEQDGGNITLGGPVANTTLYVLDAHRNLVPAGVSGELYIGGSGLAGGYRGQPELTRERFPTVRFDDGTLSRLYKTGDRVKRSEDGSLVFLGRMDRQIKFNGFRIELGEIEQVMNAQPGVEDSVVMKVQLASGQELLAGFMIPKPEQAPNIEEIRRGLAKFLPKYMQPARLLVLTEVPLTPNGKLDRKRLPELIQDDEVAESEAPMSGAEQALAAIWCELLNVKAVGRRDSFFDLGGHSLVAARFIALANRTFGHTFTLASFVQAPTIAQFAQIVEGHSTPEMRLAKRGSTGKQLLWLGADPWLARLARHLGDDLTMYTFTLDAASFAPSGKLLDIETMATQLVARIRKVQPHGPYVLGSYCVHGLLAVEIAQQLQREGEELGLVVLADLYAPGRNPQWPTRVQRLMQRIRLESFHLMWMLRWPLNEWAPYLLHRWEGIRKMRNAAAPCDLQAALEIAELQYTATRYRGKVLFLESDEGRLFKPTTSGSWSELIEEMEVFTYPGEHEAVLKEPHLGRAAEVMQKAIDRTLARGCSRVSVGGGQA